MEANVAPVQTQPANPASERTRAGPSGGRITATGLVVGSLCGIAAWAFFYVLGAAALLLAGVTTAAPGPLWLGCYGALSAGLALGAGAFAAARCDRLVDQAEGALCGLAMASMANLTLCLTAAALEAQVLPVRPGLVGSVLAVGQAAIGLGRPAAATLAFMGAVMVLSFALGAAGGACATRIRAAT